MLNIQGEPAPGHSSGDAMAAMDALVKQLPQGVGAEWSGLSYEERLSGAGAMARSTARASASGISGRRSRHDGTGPLTRRAVSARAVRPRYGSSPVSASKRSVPSP